MELLNIQDENSKGMLSFPKNKLGKKTIGILSKNEKPNSKFNIRNLAVKFCNIRFINKEDLSKYKNKENIVTGTIQRNNKEYHIMISFLNWEKLSIFKRIGFGKIIYQLKDYYAALCPTLENKPKYRHKCSVCNKTELDDKEMIFRFCSVCQKEFCMDCLPEHKKTHQPVLMKKDVSNN